MKDWSILHWTFIGGGNMAEALLSAAIGPEGLSMGQVRVIDPDATRRKLLTNTLGIRCDASVDDWMGTDVVVLAVKPQVLQEVLAALPPWPNPLPVISIAAGIPGDKIAAWLPAEGRVVRVMPNTPAMVGAGASGIAPGPGAGQADLEVTRAFFRRSGRVVDVTEEHLHAVTALSGSGPAYFFRMVEAMTEAGEALGLSASVARELAEATCRGAGEMLFRNDLSAAELRARVTSKGGTTAAALEAFEAGGFSQLVHTAMQAAAERSKELSGNA